MSSVGQVNFWHFFWLASIFLDLNYLSRKMVYGSKQCYLLIYVTDPTQGEKPCSYCCIQVIGDVFEYLVGMLRYKENAYKVFLITWQVGTRQQYLCFLCQVTFISCLIKTVVETIKKNVDVNDLSTDMVYGKAQWCCSIYIADSTQWEKTFFLLLLLLIGISCYYLIIIF